MSELKNPSPTRDVEVILDTFGNWYFILREGGKDLYESLRFTSLDECVKDSVSYLDELHELKPLLCNTRIFGGCV